jgi:transcription elongation GreA/GreB family factor
MDLAFAADSLKPIPADHILARKASDLDALREMAALQHLNLIRIVLESYGGRATLEQIQAALVPDVITEDWRKWWEMAKKELKKSGHFLVPIKKNDPVVYQAKEISLQNRVMVDFRAAKGLKARLIVAQELIKNLADLTDAKTAVSEALNALNAEIASHQRTQPAVALEAIYVRDNLCKVSDFPAQEGEVTFENVWRLIANPGEVLDQMPSAIHKQALQTFRAALPEQWSAILLNSLNSMSSKLCGEVSQLLISEGKFDELKLTLARLISQHLASSELLLWLARERTDAFADILGPEVFRAMLSAIERDQFLEKKSNRLGDFILSDQELIVELIEAADLEVIKDMTRTLQLSPSFDDMDRRSLLARIVKHFPAIQSMISGDHSKQETHLVVSWDSLERRRVEYNELVHKTIPANSKEIAIARSYGDLRENHEYKAAKEMQKLLLRRKSELETDLARSRGTDFLNPRLDVVSIGTRINVTDLNTEHPETFTILGAWDFDLEHGIISYLSPVAQALLNHAIGEVIEFELEKARKRYRVDAITPFKTA